MAKWWKKSEKKNAKYTPPTAHSMLLALEPRQVFDGALGAAIAEVMVDPDVDNHDSGPDPGDDFGIMPMNGEVGGAPVDPSNYDAKTNTFSLSAGSSLSLSNIKITGADASSLPHTLTLSARGGTFTGGDPSRLSDDGKTLTFTNMTIADINEALESYNLAAPSSNKPVVEAGFDWFLADEYESDRGSFALDYSPAERSVSGEDGLKLTLTDDFTRVVENNTTSTIWGVRVSGGAGETLQLIIEANGVGGQFTTSGYVPGVTAVASGNTLTLTGTAEDINIFLGWKENGEIGESHFNYHPGPDSKSHTVKFDLALSPLGGEAGSEIKLENIGLTVNHRPTITVDSQDFTGSLKENTPTVTIDSEKTLSFGGISVYDLNNGPDDKLEAKLTLIGGENLGKLTCTADGENTKWRYVDDTQQAIWITGATADEINDILDKVTFQGDLYANGKLNFSLTVEDVVGASASVIGGIIITDVNDKPTVEPQKPVNIFQGNVKKGEDGKAVFDPNSGALNLVHFGIVDIPGLADISIFDFEGLTAWAKGKTDAELIAYCKALGFETPIDQVVITITETPGQGELINKGSLMGKNEIFSLVDLIRGNISYSHNGDAVSTTAGGTDSFTFTVNDGSSTTEAKTVNINISPVNEDFSVTTNMDEDGGRLPIWIWEGQQGADFWTSANNKGAETSTHGQPILPGTGGDRFNGVIEGNQIDITVNDDKLSEIKVEIDLNGLNGRGTLYLDLRDYTAGERSDLGSWPSIIDLSNIPDGFVITADLLECLRFNDNGAEPPKVGEVDPTFSFTFTDRYGANNGTPPPNISFELNGPLSRTYTFVIKIAPNNDDPVLNQNNRQYNPDPNSDYIAGIGSDSADGRKVVDAGSEASRLVNLQNLLKAYDVDSSTDMLTFTIQSNPLFGRILYQIGTTIKDGQEVKTYQVLGLGNSFTQADIDAGRVFFEYNGPATVSGEDAAKGHDNVYYPAGGDDPAYYELDTFFEFTVTDGGITSWPDLNHAGGVYEMDDNGQYILTDGKRTLKVFQFEIYLRDNEGRGGQGDATEYVTPKPPVITVKPPESINENPLTEAGATPSPGAFPMRMGT